MIEPPVYIEIADLARAIGWSPKRTLGWMRRVGVAVQDGRRVYTTLARLRELVPEAAEEIERRLSRAATARDTKRPPAPRSRH